MSEEKKLSKEEKKARKEAKKARKEEKKDKKKRKRSEDLDADDAEHNSSDDGDAKEQKKKKKEKKSQSKSKSKESGKSSAEDRKKDRAAKKAAKKAEKASLLAQVPTVDEHGISYTKIQIRRMTRRVKRGLPPVPTEEEERERLRQNKLDKEEEEKELAGMLHSREDEDDEDDSGDESEDGGDDDEAGDEQNEDIAGDEDDNEEEDKPAPKPQQQQQQQPPKKKSKRSKPVPADYTCMACQNKHTPAHWIYDCPDKERRPGSNHVKKKLRGINQPSSCKVFVSGLPFEIKSKDVEKYFALACGKVVHCKLLTFEDTKRCKGQAFITFEEEESAKKALKMTGEVLDYEPDDGGKKKKKKGGDAGTPKKALTLRVSKVKNRVATGGRKF